MNRFLLLAIFLYAANGAYAETSVALCAAAKKEVHADSWLASEVAAVFGQADFAGKEEDCLYPLKVLRYASADVLLVQAGVPGEGCHGCEARLSAYVNQRTGGGLRPIAKFREFTKLGSFGAVMDVWPIEGDWPYVWLDATYLKVRRGGRIVSTAVAIAIGVNGDGWREVLGLDICPSEAETFWSEFLRKLARRGVARQSG